MNYTFKKHPISAEEKIWLKEAAKVDAFDPKVALARLWKQLGPEFRSDKIDPRLYSGRRTTLIGLWHVDPESKAFKLIDATVRAIRDLILENPGINELRLDTIARKADLSEGDVASAIYELGQLGGYYTATTGANAHPISIELRDEHTYNAYLRYKSVDDLLEQFYVARDPASSLPVFLAGSTSTLVYPTNYTPLAGPAVQAIEQVSIKKGAAFVLMAIDPSKPELEDVYNAIKEACREFGINAYRADEIQHQERITEVILQEICTCEYLIADLSHERPNVYYEVGFAHALDKKPILYRKIGTRLHFDLAVHNVPEYKNATELRKLLRLRLEAITGRSPVMG